MTTMTHDKINGGFLAELWTFLLGTLVGIAALSLFAADCVAQGASAEAISQGINQIIAFLNKQGDEDISKLAIWRRGSKAAYAQRSLFNIKKDVSSFSAKLTNEAAAFPTRSRESILQQLNDMVVPPSIQQLFVDGADDDLPLPPHLALSAFKAVRLPDRVAPYVVGVGSSLTLDYPSVAEIGYATLGEGHSAICTGTLISADSVLTAAHCFCTIEGIKETTWSSCKGATYERGGKGGERVVTQDPKYFSVFFQDIGPVEIADITIHPHYKWPVSDLAIVNLKSHITNIAPARLNDIGRWPDGEYGHIVGFGAHSGLGKDGVAVDFKPNLSKPGLKLWGTVKTTKCNDAADRSALICWLYQRRNSDEFLASTCHGDSGGPLFVEFPNGGWRLAGVTSGGNDWCKVDSTEQSFDVDVFQEKNLSWILQKANIKPTRSTIDSTDPFLRDLSSNVHRDPYHHFTNKPIAISVRASFKALYISINATPTPKLGKLKMLLTPPNGIPKVCQFGDTKENDSFATCFERSPVVGQWTLVVSGEEFQEAQILGSGFR